MKYLKGFYTLIFLALWSNKTYNCNSPIKKVINKRVNVEYEIIVNVVEGGGH